MSRLLVLAHRWLGVFLWLFMAVWFASGAVLIYVPFPSLSENERLDRSGDVDTSMVTLTPADAIRVVGAAQAIDGVRLVARQGRPVYIVKLRGQPSSTVWADTGGSASLGSEASIRDIAEQYSGATARQIDGPIGYDQWTVHQGFDSKRPFFRVKIDDDAQTVLYVSQRTGELVQRTTRVERTWNYVGAVAHWIYPTVLRRHWAAWDKVVWSLSFAGIAVVVIGVWLGFARMIIALRVPGRKISLYRGLMRWHHILGLTTCAFVFTWIFSGWLSMDHGRIFSVPNPTTEQLDRYRGITIRDAAKTVSVDFLRGLTSFREVKITAVSNTPLVIKRSHGDAMIYSAGSGKAFARAMLPKSLIAAAVLAAWPAHNIWSVEEVPSGDSYARVRHSPLPPSTIRVALDDSGQTWVHVDAMSGEIVSIMDRGRRLYRWIYHGLHSLDFPGLAGRRPLWDIVILTLLFLGFSFSVTGAILGMKRLKQSVTVTAAGATNFNAPDLPAP